VGFPLADATGELPQAVRALIDEHGPPLVFAPGTGAGNAQAFVEAARECCEVLDAPGVILGSTSAPRKPHADKLLHVSYVELGLLLKQASLVVHHGGMGTTARALEAGIPQIVSPQAFDQPDNADRVARLGVGLVLPRQTLSGPALAAAVRALLTSPRARERALVCGRAVRGSNGVGRAVDVLVDQFVTRRSRTNVEGATSKSAPSPVSRVLAAESAPV
jgi:UDP:flavonoid glycosyltransferase YjiC (YdhE family)